ncbi:outer membrane lipoprotein-sorting protein [Spirochaetia bacterium]|nr:outer membrane lipoprotein-sorting protein [Spirochaetia bacterium]
MNLKKITSVLVLILAASLAGAQNLSDIADKTAFAGERLDAMYEAMNYGNSDFSATMTMVVEKPNETTRNLQYKYFSRPDKEQFTMVQVNPPAGKGTGYLVEDDNFWIYDPEGRKFTHSSLKENIESSDRKASDMVNRNEWRDDYRITGITEGKLGAYPVWIIAVEAISSRPSYAKVSYHIRKDIPLLLKQEDFSAAGRLMRTTLIPKYSRVGTRYVTAQIISRDELNPGEQTQQVLSDVSFAKLPDMVFTKAYLENLN